MQFINKRWHWWIAILAFAYFMRLMATFVLDRIGEDDSID